MAIAKTTTGAKLALIAILIPIGVVAWLLAPFVLPVWKWRHLDGANAWARIAKEKGVSEALLRTEYQAIIRHAPRIHKDPIPWQLVSLNPTWISQDEEKHEDETDVLVRCSVISDRDGTPPSDLWVGANQDEKFFKCKVWRFPPGSFNQNAKRPVLIYRASTLERLTIGEGKMYQSQVANMQNDDKWEDRDDGIGSPSSGSEE